MKLMTPIRLFNLTGAAAFATVLLWAATATSQAQTPNIYIVNDGAGMVEEYDSTTGANILSLQVLPAPSSGLSFASGIALSGANMYIANVAGGFVYECNATTGAIISSFGTSGSIGGFNNPEALALSGNHLYVADSGNNAVQEYDATTGALISAFVSPTNLTTPVGLAISGNNLYIGNLGSVPPGDPVIGEYDATTGAQIAAFNVPIGGPDGPNFPTGLAIAGNDLYVADGGGDNTIREFDATTGAAIAGWTPIASDAPHGIAVEDNLLYVVNDNNGGAPMATEYDATTGAVVAGFSAPTDLNSPAFIEFVPSATPEPGSATLLVLGAGALLGWRPRRKIAMV